MAKKETERRKRKEVEERKRGKAVWRKIRGKEEIKVKED